MNKRITSLLLSVVMILSLLVTAVPVWAAGTTSFSVTSDKTKAVPGETVTYTITMAPVQRLDSLKFTLKLSSGLTVVPGSGKLTTGLKDTLKCVDTAWTESTKIFYVTLCDEGTGYSSENPTVLMTLQCTVDDGASGDLTADLIIDPEECYDPDYDNIAFTVTPATVTITAAPKPATNIKLNKSETTIYTGNTETLVATVEPSDTTDTVVWTSSKESVATVDNTGKVTAVATGTATITATAGSQSASCVVTVENAPCTHTNKTYIGEKPSTCTKQGWDAYSRCDNCGQRFDMEGNPISEIPFRPLADHKYTANEKKPEALKTAGTCKDKAIYLRSCEVCGKVAPSEAWGSFFGDLDPNNHAGGTTTVNASEPDHKNQVAGYTGDTKCLGCNEIIAYGTTIPAGAHTPSSTWNSNETHHWKECTTMGCGVVIDGSKAEHSSTGANVATCQHKAVCDVCNAEYGALAAHNPASGWTSDASGHWHACQTASCTEKCDFASHTPDHTGHATEEYAIKCTECGYVIEAQLGHTHVFDKEVATDAYKASDATCTAKATYYKSCDCGEKGTETFEYGELAEHNWKPATCIAPKTCSVCGATEGDALGHTEGTEWKSDADNHWHVCTVAGCGVVIESSKAAHTASDWITDTAATATTDGTKHKECTVCTHVLETGTIPATGSGEHTHSYGSEWKSDADKHWHECSCGDKKDTAAHTAGEWIIDTPATATTSGSKHKECTVCGYTMTTETIPATGGGEHTHSYGSEWKNDATNHWHECSCGDKADVAAHSFKWVVDKEATATQKGSKHEECKVCGYKKAAVEIPATGSTTKPTDPTGSNPSTGADVPQTGENSNMMLWFAVLFVSGFGVLGTVIYGKKRKSVK